MTPMTFRPDYYCRQFHLRVICSKLLLIYLVIRISGSFSRIVYFRDMFEMEYMIN